MTTYTDLDTPDTLNTYVEQEWAQDCRIDKSDMEHESARVPELHHKYYKLFRLARRFAYDRQHAYNQLKLLRMEYWGGRLDEAKRKQFGWEPNALRLTPTDIKEYLSNDAVLHQAHGSVETANSLVEFLTEIVKQINARNYTCKNVIDALRFSHGQL